MQTHSFATREQPPPPSSASNSTSPTKTDDPYEDIRQFHRFTDIYLGGLWNRLEKELGKIENESPNFDYEINVTSGCMRVTLPNDAKVVICKSPRDQELKVESNLHMIYGAGDSNAEGADPREEASFKFVEEQGEFVATDQPGHGGVPLHQFLEGELAKHLNIELDLEPQPGPHDKT